ncbi:MAG TPA: hypothetical protein VKA97_07830, partial [Pyrinomonadaceae bacterium]|nr:hypothetical protein [Pyrinomonadaceae bacterium]
RNIRLEAPKANAKAPRSAEGAEYESQGQARSASPLVAGSNVVQGLKGRNKQTRYYALAGLR